MRAVDARIKQLEEINSQLSEMAVFNVQQAEAHLNIAVGHVRSAIKALRAYKKPSLPLCYKCNKSIRDTEYAKGFDGECRHLNACPQ